jgi:pantothenate kinase-related protein Tda10
MGIEAYGSVVFSSMKQILNVPDKYDPDHFMPWVHPFTSVISGPTGSGKSVFVRRFVHTVAAG